jgi:hypothetical protein
LGIMIRPGTGPRHRGRRLRPPMLGVVARCESSDAHAVGPEEPVAIGTRVARFHPFLPVHAWRGMVLLRSPATVTGETPVVMTQVSGTTRSAGCWTRLRRTRGRWQRYFHHLLLDVHPLGGVNHRAHGGHVNLIVGLTLYDGCDKVAGRSHAEVPQFSYVVVVLFPPSHHVCRELYRRFRLRRALRLPAFDSDGVDEHVAILIADRSFIAYSVKPRPFLLHLFREGVSTQLPKEAIYGTTASPMADGTFPTSTRRPRGGWSRGTSKREVSFPTATPTNRCGWSTARD